MPRSKKELTFKQRKEGAEMSNLLIDNPTCPEEKCKTNHCEHIKVLLKYLDDNELFFIGDTQMVAIKCAQCGDVHGF